MSHARNLFTISLFFRQDKAAVDLFKADCFLVNRSVVILIRKG